MQRPIPAAVCNPARACAALLSAVLLTLGACSSGDSGGPVARADALTVGEGGTVTTTSDGRFNLMENDVGLSGSAVVAATPAAGPQYGTVELAADGTFRYVHDGSENHEDSFSYTVVDGGKRSEGAVAVTVDPVDDAPQLTDDSYTNGVGNTFLAVGRGTGRAVAVQWTGSVLHNDTDADGSLRVTDHDAASERGGEVSMEMDGTFAYLPPVGFTGTDTFTYTASDGSDSATATVSITVTGMVWYVDGDRSEAGDGRSGAPFQTLAQLQQAAGVGDDSVVYVLDAAADYAGPYTLDPGQVLVGEGSAFAYGGLDLPAGRTPKVVSPTGAGLVLGVGSEVRGFEIGDTQGAGLEDYGQSDLTLTTVQEVVISGSGQAVSFANGNIDVTLDSVTTTSSASHGLMVDACEGAFQVLGETTTTAATANGIRVSTNNGPDQIDLRFGGLVSVVGSGGPAIWLAEIDGNTSFGDVDILSRGGYGIMIDVGSGTATFRDVDIANGNDGPGDGVVIHSFDGAVTFASLDVSHVVDANDPGSNAGLRIVGCPSDFRFETTAQGLQRDGGSFSDIAGYGIYLATAGLVTLREIDFSETHVESILASQNLGSLLVERCTFASWSQGTGADVGAIQWQSGVQDTSLTVTASDFDASATTTTMAPIVSVVGGSGRTDLEFGGIDQEGQPRLSNTMTGVRRDGLVLAGSTGQLVADVTGSAFATASGRRGVDAFVTGGSLSLGVERCSFEGPFEVCVGISGPGGNPTGARSFATIQQNTVTGAQRFVDVIQESVTEMHTLVSNNTALGLTVGVVNYGGAPAGPAEMLIDGGSYTVVPGNPLEPAIIFALDGAFAAAVTDMSLLGFDSATHAAVDLATSVGNGATSTLLLDENGFGDPTVAAFQAVLESGSAGTLQLAASGHTEGLFVVTQQDGTFAVEDMTNFAANNPGAALQGSGTITVLTPNTVSAPAGPWR